MCASFILMTIRKTISSLAVATLVILNAACTTKPPSCPEHFYDGAPPVITKESLTSKTHMLCFEGYAVMESGVSRTPIWSAEHLTAQRIETAKGLKRHNTFHAEEQLPPSDRAELADYVHSGYDRGHMSPSGDMPTDNAQHESFSLANMIPQSPKNNQILWEGVEEATRTLAETDGEVYVVTGPIFEGDSLERLNGRVLVPTFIYKAIYDPAKQTAGAYVTPNAPGMTYQTLSIADLEKRIGINVFPKLSPEIKATKMSMPAPTPHGFKKSRKPPTEVDE
jgi:endonuclease G